MFLTDLFKRGSLPLLEKVVEFTEQRHQVLAHNIANIDTPYFKAVDLDTAGFRRMLRDAVAAKRRAPRQVVDFHGTRDLRLAADGTLAARPVRTKSGNILFHDQSNRNVEKLMAELAKNTMQHNLAVSMLREQFQALETAIRGKL